MQRKTVVLYFLRSLVFVILKFSLSYLSDAGLFYFRDSHSFFHFYLSSALSSSFCFSRVRDLLVYCLLRAALCWSPASFRDRNSPSKPENKSIRQNAIQGSAGGFSSASGSPLRFISLLPCVIYVLPCRDSPTNSGEKCEISSTVFSTYLFTLRIIRVLLVH